MLVVLGSIAAQEHIPEFRDAKDLDLLGPYEEIQQYAQRTMNKITAAYPTAGGKKGVWHDGKYIVEGEFTWPYSTGEELYRLVSIDPMTKREGANLFPSLDVLLAIKLTHRYLKNSPHFLKTMRDIQIFRDRGAHTPQSTQFLRWMERRVRETYAYAHPSLMKPKDKFFAGDGVNYVYDHDSIHEAMAEKCCGPAYHAYAVEDHEVLSSKEKFFEVSEETRLRGVLEEALVLAIERSQVPYPETAPKRSFDIALMKVCTSITSGWFRTFAWEHYDEVQAMYEPDYVDRFWAAVKSGKVRKL